MIIRIIVIISAPFRAAAPAALVYIRDIFLPGPIGIHGANLSLQEERSF